MSDTSSQIESFISCHLRKRAKFYRGQSFTSEEHQNLVQKMQRQCGTKLVPALYLFSSLVFAVNNLRTSFAAAEFGLVRLSQCETIGEGNHHISFLRPAIFDTYDAVLGQNVLLPVPRDVLRSALAWVLHCRRPLTIEELGDVLAMTPTGEAYWTYRNTGANISECGLFGPKFGIFRVNSDSTVQFYDSCLPKYLLDRSSALGLDAMASPIPGIILSYLLNPDLQRAVFEYQSLENQNSRWPFFKYATAYWDDHVRGSAEVSHHGRIKALLSAPIIGRILRSRNFTGYVGPRVEALQHETISTWNRDRQEASRRQLFLPKSSPRPQDPTREGSIGTDSSVAPSNLLDLAVLFRLAKTASLLLQRSVDSQGRVLPASPLTLELALAHGEPEIASELIRIGTSLNWRDASGRSPLEIGLKTSVSLKSSLIDAIISTMDDDQVKDISDIDGNTALHLVTMHGNAAVVKDLATRAPYLLHAVNSSNESPLHTAIRKHDIEVALVLLELGIDPSIKSHSGTNSLALAMHGAGSPEIVRAILAADMSRVQDPRLSVDQHMLAKAWLASTAAWKKKLIRRDELALQQWAAKKEVNNSGELDARLFLLSLATSIMRAGLQPPPMPFGESVGNRYTSVAVEGNVNDLEHNLSKRSYGGYNINWKDMRTGYTALHTAAWNASYPGTLLLLAAGADPIVENVRGRTAWDIADAIGDEDLACLFGEGWKSAKLGERTGWEWRLWAREIAKRHSRSEWGRLWSDK